MQLTSEPEAVDGELAEEAPTVQLNLFSEPMEGKQVSLFPSEAQQIQSITEAESAEKAPFAFSIPQEGIDQILRFGSNTENSRMRVAAEFMKTEIPGGDRRLSAKGIPWRLWCQGQGRRYFRMVCGGWHPPVHPIRVSGTFFRIWHRPAGQICGRGHSPKQCHG